MDALVSRLEAVTQKLENISGSQTCQNSTQGSQPYVAAFNDLIKRPLAKFFELSSKLGGDVASQAALVKGAFEAQASFLNTASQCKKPSSDQVLAEVVKPISDKICDIQTFKEEHRRSVHINHLSAISESIPALGWVLMTPTPGPYVKEMMDAGQFYTNRVLKEFKDKDVAHVEWVKGWMQVLGDLHTYVKNFHTTGVCWSNKGAEAKSSIGAAAPPPPPMMPPPPPPSDPSPAQQAGDGRAQLFAELNKGEGITSSLKKVTDDQKTHKNPALRGAGVVPSVKGSKPAVPAKNIGKSAKPAKLELEGKKWIVENYQDNNSLQVADTEMKQTVYIYNCNKCTIVVKGKINAITMDSCKKTALMFEECISSVDFVNCQSVKAQVTGKVPIVNIDKTDGCMLYLSQKSLDTQVVTAKSSEMNVMVPDAQNEYKELPIPEQFKTYWNGQKLVTEVTDVTLG